LQSYQQRFVPPQFSPYAGVSGGAQYQYAHAHGSGQDDDSDSLPSSRRRRRGSGNRARDGGGGGGGTAKARRRLLYEARQREQETETRSLAAPQSMMNVWFTAIGAGAVMVVLLAVGDLMFAALWSSASNVHPHVAQLCAIIVGGGWLMLLLVFWLASRGVT
jgi:hypothetical protein